MTKLFIYNFNGDIYETTEVFDATYKAKRNKALANGEKITRQVVSGNKIENQYYTNGIWLDE